ncbi:MAG TPA: capsule assembly Wzi family protein [Gillisia sp.]|nr:capsule assembly Wzi family protein [Gillisia sp.]
MRITLLPLFFLFLFTSAFSQVQFSGNFTGKGIAFSGEESPFWMHSNQRGRMNELSNVSALLGGFASYNITENARFTLGVGALYQDGYIDDLQLDEAFLGFENSWLAIHVGRKQRADLYRGLSATNENIVWSLNARPLPGISLSTTRPIMFWKDAGLGFQASLEEFFTDDERYVMDTRVHHKSFHLVWNKVPNFQFTVGLEHFAQWAGTSPDHGKLPSGFDDYLKVFTASGLGGESDDFIDEQEVNALGNHLGSYVAGVKTSLQNYNIEVIYNHIFEDGSGQRLGNTPDGRYGIFITDQQPGKWVDSFMYEFFYTKHQSRTSSGTDGADNYFNNHLYRSGWTYENRILGVPFIFLDEDRFRVINNIVAAHHVGISGTGVLNMPYRLLASYRKNYGAKGGGQLRSDILSTYMDLNVYQSLLNVNLLLGADFTTVASPNFAAGVQVSKTLF